MLYYQQVIFLNFDDDLKHIEYDSTRSIKARLTFILETVKYSSFVS